MLEDKIERFREVIAKKCEDIEIEEDEEVDIIDEAELRKVKKRNLRKSEEHDFILDILNFK